MDAVVIGAGPNGLAAAILLAQHGCSVTVFEAAPSVGGGARSAELTLPGFVHDVCSAVHPLGAGSPFFSSLPLGQHGLAWVHPQAPLAHPLEDDAAAVLSRDLQATADTLDRDADSYRSLFQPLTRHWPGLLGDILGPLRLPRHPLPLARFGIHALRSAQGLAGTRFQGAPARALFAGLAAHSALPLDWAATSAFALVLGAAAHAVGWPFARGGSQNISDALASYLRSLGGKIVTGTPMERIEDVPAARAVLCDVTPRQLLHIAGHKLPGGYRRALERYRYGVGACKIDWALAAPIPWRAPECAHAGTVHLGGTLEEIAAGEREVWRGRTVERPFVLLAQPTLFDGTRAPAGRHVAWAYCHVPAGCTEDMTGRIEAQVERFAPGFRDSILGRSIMRPPDLEAYNANYVGGDINGGAQHLAQMFLRPTARMYATPLRGLYLCSSATPPGGGVHGMCGYFAARLALRQVFGIRTAPLT